MESIATMMTGNDGLHAMNVLLTMMSDNDFFSRFIGGTCPAGRHAGC